MRRHAGAPFRWAVVVAASALSAGATAWALGFEQDYKLAATTGLLEARPASATAMTTVTTAGSGATKGTSVDVHLPFEFLYYTTKVESITISPFLFILPRAVSSIPSSQYPPTGFTLPVTSGTFDGVIALCWCKSGANPVYVNESPSTGMVYTWTSGVEPDRHFVISWENATVTSGAGSSNFTYQIHLYEGTGRIVFAYSPKAGSVAPGSCVLGIDSPVDSRYTARAVAGSFTGNSGSAEVDFTFDPVRVTYSGTLLCDRIVSDASGYGGSVLPGAPLAGRTVELRRTSDSAVLETATTADDGSFAITAVGLPSGPTASLVVPARNDACSVGATATSPPTAWTLAVSLSMVAGFDVGTRTLGAPEDPDGDIRAALDVARECLAARKRIGGWTPTPPPKLAVLLDPASAEATIYKPAAGTGAASLRIASRKAPNPDAFDDAIVTKAYGRHALASIADAPTTAYDDRFDVAADDQNAFAEAFGYWLWTAVSGSSTAVDGTAAGAATVHDLESPAAASPKGADVAGRVAGALHDLLDPADEPTDTVDGSTTAETVYVVADSIVGAPTASTFQQAWIDAGHDASNVSRAYIANGVVVDDEFEANDVAAEAPALGAVPLAKPGLVLNRFNEDWFSVTLPGAASSLMVDVSPTPFSIVDVEIRDATGATISTSAYQSLRHAVNAFTTGPGPLAAGAYSVRVRLVSGAPLAPYTFQAYVTPTMNDAPIRDWTVGRNYDSSVGASGGIPPFALSTVSSFMPPGLSFDAERLHVVGRPSDPGRYLVTVELRDGGDPVNFTQRRQFVTIHEAFKMPVPPFVAFASGKSAHAAVPTHEGTPPFAVSMTSGALPPGLTFDAASLGFVGTAEPAPSSAFELDGVDVAGSSDHVATRAVVAMQATGKRVPAELTADVDASGWWFDAVEGSRVTFAVATSRGRAKRTLAGALLAPDRSLVATGSIKARRGALLGSRFVCPQSGRYFLVASSDDAGAATQLLATVNVALPRSGKGSATGVSTDDETKIQFGAVEGSTAVVKFAGDRTARVAARVVAVLGPQGTPVAFTDHVKPTPFGGTLTIQLPFGGTWTVVLRGVSTSGVPGRITYSYVLRQKKGAVYAAE